MEDLLRSWGLEELVPRLLGCGIEDTEALLCLKPEHAGHIFAENELGLQLKLFNRLERQRQPGDSIVLAVGSLGECVEVGLSDTRDDTTCNATSVSSGSYDSSKHSLSPDEFDYSPSPKKPRGTVKVGLRAIDNLDIITLLTEDSAQGPALLQYFKVHKTFTKQHRGKLTSIVITAARKLSYYLKNENFECLSEKINEAFPGEFAKIYYLAPYTEGPSQTISKGKLPIRYRNVLKKERELAGETSRPSTSRQNSQQNTADPYRNITSAEITSDVKEAHVWLKGNLLLDDWPLLKTKWRLSAPLRLRNLFQDKSSEDAIANYILQWPCLKHPSGYTLMELDFNCLYPDKDVSLLARWDVFVANILKLASQEVNDTVAKDCLVLAKNTTHAGSKGVLALNILPALCPPTTRVKGKGAKATEQRRLLVSNSRAGLLLHVTDTASLSLKLKQRREILFANAKKSQPFLVFVGPKLTDIKEYYVDVSGILYRLHSVSKAVDVCFKATVALHASFPSEAVRPWMLIQRLLYDITSKWDAEVPYDVIASYNVISQLEQ